MADNLNTVNIIRYLQSKNSDSTFSSPSYLGSEARFVTPTKNTNLNNLEEELLLGCDTITEQWVEENGDIKTSIQYHDGTAKGYYLLESIIYNQPIYTNSGVSIGADETGIATLNLSNEINTEISNENKENPSEPFDYNVLYINNNGPSLSEEGMTFGNFMILKIDTLSYVNNSDKNNPIITIIAKKETSQKNENGKIITKEKIIREF